MLVCELVGGILQYILKRQTDGRTGVVDGSGMVTVVVTATLGTPASFCSSCMFMQRSLNTKALQIYTNSRVCTQTVITGNAR